MSRSSHPETPATSKNTKLKQTDMGNYLTTSSNTRTLRSSTKSKMETRRRKADVGSWLRMYSARDTEEYRKGYPGKKEHKSWRDNLEFHMNNYRSRPDGDYIDDIHENWWGDYDRLEQHHGFVQWLFPIRESGMNWYAQELQLHEAETIQKEPKAHKRFLMSYEMMLDFYGMMLKDRKTGEIERAVNWEPRFHHLNHSMHNYLRITRILKSLGELGFEHMKKPFVKFVLYEGLVEGTLDNTLKSCIHYWIEVLKSKEEREELKLYVQEKLAELDSKEGSDEEEMGGNVDEAESSHWGKKYGRHSMDDEDFEQAGATGTSSRPYHTMSDSDGEGDGNRNPRKHQNRRKQEEDMDDTEPLPLESLEMAHWGREDSSSGLYSEENSVTETLQPNGEEGTDVGEKGAGDGSKTPETGGRVPGDGGKGSETRQKGSDSGGEDMETEGTTSEPLVEGSGSGVKDSQSGVKGSESEEKRNMEQTSQRLTREQKKKNVEGF